MNPRCGICFASQEMDMALHVRPKKRKLGAGRKRPMPARVRHLPASFKERRRHRIEPEKVFDLLSELLAVEEGLSGFYAQARERAPFSEIRERLEYFLSVSEGLEDELYSVIRDLGGNPFYMSPSARLQNERLEMFKKFSAPPRFQPFSDIETVLQIETEQHLMWSFFNYILPFFEDERAQDILGPVVEKMENEKATRVAWARQAFNRLKLEEVTEPNKVRAA